MSTKHTSNYPQLISTFVFAATFSFGLSLTTVVNPKTSWSFFDLTLISNSQWNPAILLVFATALITNFIMYWGVAMPMKKPMFAEKYHAPSVTSIDSSLVFGSLIFGLGWAFSGYCPGPSVIGALTGQLYPLVNVAAMYLGFMIVLFVKASDAYKTTSLPRLFSENNTLTYFIITLLLFVVPFVLRLDQIDVLNVRTDIKQVAFGAIIMGLSVGLLYLTAGKILGLSGMFRGLVDPQHHDKTPNLVFLLGVVLTTNVLRVMAPHLVITPTVAYPLWRSVVGGLIVGLGTSLSNGCTSGHGLCGVTRLSVRSIVATASFFSTAMLFTNLFSVILPL